MKSKLFEIPFDEKLLDNPFWEYEEKPDWMYKEDWEKMKEIQNRVLFKNIDVQYEICDCGGEYGCSHNAYPYALTINKDESIESMFEDDGIYVSNRNGHIKFDDLTKITIGHFATACELLGIKLEYTEEGNKIINGTSNS